MPRPPQTLPNPATQPTSQLGLRTHLTPTERTQLDTLIANTTSAIASRIEAPHNDYTAIQDIHDLIRSLDERLTRYNRLALTRRDARAQEATLRENL